MDSAAQQFENAVSALGPPATNSSLWTGADADRFRSEWSSTIVPALRRVAADLHDASGRLRHEAAEQDNVSSASGTAAGGGAAGGASVGGPSSHAGSVASGNGFAVSPETVRDLAMFAAGKISPDFGTAADIVGYVDQFDDLATSLHDGDGLNSVNAAVGIAGNLMREAPPGPIALMGSAVGLYQFIGEQAAQADFSQQGLATVGNYIVNDPVGALQGAGEGIVANSAEILGLVPVFKGVHL